MMHSGWVMEFQNIGIELVPLTPLATPRHSRFDPELTLIHQYTWRSLRFLHVNIFLQMNLPPVPSFRTFTESVRSNHMMTPWTQQCLCCLWEMQDPQDTGLLTRVGSLAAYLLPLTDALRFGSLASLAFQLLVLVVFVVASPWFAEGEGVVSSHLVNWLPLRTW